MKKAVIYARYSSHNQTEQSIEGQVHVCEKYAAENGYKIIESYIDRAITGTSDKRPEFQRMITDSKAGTFDTIMVYKLDRFARNRYDSALYKKKLQDNGIRVVSATEQITNGPEGIIMEGLLEAMDEYYSAELSRKTKRGFEESFKKGHYLNPAAPYGYKVVDHRLTVDEETAPIAQEIFKRFSEGERYSDIITDLNNRHIPNAAGNRWNKVNLAKMLPKRIYIGEYTREGIEGTITCPAIITKEMFEMVQKSREERIHNSRERRTDFTYYLTGKIYCGKCNGRMYGDSTQKGKYHYYHCENSHPGSCIRADELHERIKEALKRYLTEDKIEELALAGYEEYESGNQYPNDSEIKTKLLESIEKKIENIIKAIMDGFASEELKVKLSKLEQEKAEIKDELERIESRPPKLKYEHFLFIMKNIVENAANDDFKKLIDTIVNRVIIKDETAIICINLTNENNTPPLEQILVKISDADIPQTHPEIKITEGWMIIAA